MTPEPYSPEEVHRLERNLVEGRDTVCPRCSVPLDRRAIGPRSDVSYVRERLWLACALCHRSVVIDRHPR